MEICCIYRVFSCMLAFFIVLDCYLPKVWKQTLHICLFWSLVLYGWESIPESVTVTQADWNNAAKFLKIANKMPSLKVKEKWIRQLHLFSLARSFTSLLYLDIICPQFQNVIQCKNIFWKLNFDLWFVFASSGNGGQLDHFPNLAVPLICTMMMMMKWLCLTTIRCTCARAMFLTPCWAICGD